MSSRKPLPAEPDAVPKDVSSPLRDIPSVHELVESPHLSAWLEKIPRQRIVDTARLVLERYRDVLSSRPSSAGRLTTEQLTRQVAGELEAAERPNLRPVINATGIILHTGLGRTPLAKSAADALHAVAQHYANVEIDLETGERGGRIMIVRDLLRELTGAESAVVVNNNAAATLMVLAAVAAVAAARCANVVVSRGELIEIGGSFRLPDIMTVSGAALREVGTTNKTRLGDYERGIDDDTAALMKIHPSNYRIEGFTQSVSIRDLVQLGNAKGLPVIHDIGSGAMMDLESFGLHDEPTAPDSVSAGADLVLFSGDKLLGGPQAGIIIGRRRWIDPIERHPLMRPLRVDKLILAALEATLRLHRDPDRAGHQLPALVMASAAKTGLCRRATLVADALRSVSQLTKVQVQETTAYLGGGALPTQGIPSVAVQLRARSVSEGELARRLRVGDQSVIPRVQEGSVWLDLRTVRPDQDDDLLRAVRRAALSC